MPQDHDEAARWYRKAAEQGNARAQNNLGFAYGTGQGAVRDYSEAIRWYRRAAKQGEADGQLNLGVMYFNGDGVPEDPVLAYVWTSLSAAQGHDNAAETRDTVRAFLNPDQLARAKDIIARCIDSDFQDCD